MTENKGDAVAELLNSKGVWALLDPGGLCW